MDFCKSRNSNSTSSNHSNSSNSNSNSNSNNNYRTHNSNSNGDVVSFSLEYNTSSSSPASPPAISAFATSMPVNPPSAAKTAIVVGSIAIDGMTVSPVTISLPPSSSSSLPSSRVSTVSAVIAATASTSAFGSTSASTSTAMRSSQKAAKRKRRTSIYLDDKDPEIGFEPPSAKRQQRLPSLYQSESSSMSSAYPSPIDELLVHDLDTASSCPSADPVQYKLPLSHDDIPDSPHSLRESHQTSDVEDDVDHDQDEDDHDDEDHDDDDDDDDDHDHDDDDDVDDEVNSGTASPSSTVSSGVSDTSFLNAVHGPYHGERTPGQGEGQSKCAATSKCTVVEQPKAQSRVVKSFDDYVSEHYSCMTPAAEPEPPRQCPLPALSWANAHDVWQLMCKKDELAACHRSSSMLEHHPGLQPRMRAILLDWLIEVCEVYKLHRETYYLAVDYLDRYLTAQKLVQKTHLQLIGITCLFVAAKVEEIYPPKIGEFAYVTDGACQESDILQHEILLLQTLEWSISPVTPMGWLGVYMQLNVNNRTPASFNSANSRANIKGTAATGTATATATATAKTDSTDDAFIYPQFSGMEFVQTAQLLDLCSLDVGIGRFSYSVLAAGAIAHTFNSETAVRCSGLDWLVIEPCARWMEPFFHVICEESTHLHLIEQTEQVASKFGLGHICPNIVTDDSHIIQTHTTTMSMFERACMLQDQFLTSTTGKIKQEASPATGLLCPEGLLTPPASSRKPLGGVVHLGDGVDATDEADDVENRENKTLSACSATKKTL